MQPIARLATRLALLGASLPAAAASTVNLPAWVCSVPDTLLRSGFQAGEQVPHEPSNGTVGAYPGAMTRNFAIAGLGTGTQQVYVYVPSTYTPARDWPLVLALHGAGGPGTAAAAAAAARDEWATIAESFGFIVAAPAGSGSSGGWIAPYAPGSGPSDYDLIAAVRDTLLAEYNINRARSYVWGYSAGGQVAHDLAQNAWNGFGASSLAAYAVSAGVLHGVTCDVNHPELYLRPACAPLLAGQPRRIPVQLHIGNSDPLLGEVQADRDRFTNAGWVLGDNLVYAIFVGGHTYAGMLATRVWPKLCPYALAP